MRRLGIVLIGMGLVFGLAFWSWPGTTPKRTQQERRSEVRQRYAEKIAKLAKLDADALPAKPKGKRKRVRRPAPPPPDDGPHPMELPVDALRAAQLQRSGFPASGDLQAQVREVIDAPLDPPLDIPDDEVAINRAYWRKNEDLGKLESSLLSELDSRPDPYGKLQVQLALVEVYQAKVDTLALYEAPSSWPEDRAERWHDKIENQIDATARKAQLLLEMSEREADRWPPDDPAVEHLNRLR